VKDLVVAKIAGSSDTATAGCHERHAGQADLIRETIDGTVGSNPRQRRLFSVPTRTVEIPARIAAAWS